MLRPVAVTAAVWATCTKRHAVYKEATREGGLFCLLLSSLLSVAAGLSYQSADFPNMTTSKNTPALCGVWLPATRASKVDFLQPLRAE
jgi:hypothetical protein